MKEFIFDFVDGYLAIWYGIASWCYKIRFRKIRNKNLYYLIFAEKYEGDQYFINIKDEDYAYGVLSDYFQFKKLKIKKLLKKNFQYEIYKNKICFPL